MTARVCITATMPSTRTCIIPGEHLGTCDGYKHRTVDNVTTRVMRELPDGSSEAAQCRGCTPALAIRGHLCDSHAAKLDYALRPFDGSPTLLVALMAHLWEADSAGISDGNDRVSTAYGSRVPIPESRITANSLADALNAVHLSLASVAPAGMYPPRVMPSTGLPVHSSTRDVAETVHALTGYLLDHEPIAVNTPDVAELLVPALAITGQAFRRWPLNEEPHRTKHVRCPGCGHLAMTWNPPLYYRDEVRVECADCGTIADQTWLEVYAATVRVNSRTA